MDLQTIHKRLLALEPQDLCDPGNWCLSMHAGTIFRACPVGTLLLQDDVVRPDDLMEAQLSREYHDLTLELAAQHFGVGGGVVDSLTDAYDKYEEYVEDEGEDRRRLGLEAVVHEIEAWIRETAPAEEVEA